MSKQSVTSFTFLLQSIVTLVSTMYVRASTHTYVHGYRLDNQFESLFAGLSYTRTVDIYTVQLHAAIARD